MITRFRVQNYKALRDVTLDLTPIHVLIGPNDSGKTSLLEALAALCRSVSSESLGDAFVGRWSGRQLVSHSAGEPVIRFACEFDDAVIHTYKCDVRFTSRGQNVSLEKEEIRTSESTYACGVIRGPRTGVSSGEPGSSYPNQQDILQVMEVVRRRLSGVHLYRWSPLFLALPVASDSRRRFRMEGNGFGLAQCLDEILGFDRSRFDALEHALRRLFPHVESIKLMTEPAFHVSPNGVWDAPLLKRSDGKGVFLKFRDDADLVPLSQASDGIALILAYLTILHLPEPPRLLLIEEPENGIHPRRLEDIARILRETTTGHAGTQVILTTHSPYLIDHFSSAEVTICQKALDGAVHVRRLSDSRPVQEQTDVFTLGEIWTGDGDDALMQPAEPQEISGP